MGGNSSTRRVSFESDENDNVMVVKGVRLSENVINRMREPTAPLKPKQEAAHPLSPLLQKPPPSDPKVSLPHSKVETVTHPPLASPPPPPPPPPPQPEQPSVETVSPAPVPEPSPVPPAASAVDEEALRKKITDELHKGLEQERAKAERDLLSWLEAEKARSSAQVQAEAKSHVRSEVSRLLSAERDAAQESVQQAILKEKIAAEDEQRRVNIYAKKLASKEADLNRQEAFYRDQVARLEERSAEIYKITTDNYHKAADQVNAKYKRYESRPVCADLQGQILACYKGNVGKTLLCSNIAAKYLECVNSAKQNMLRTAG
ncbi:coiled-coil-helix-coiled-coil-helix domain containing 3a isoform 2-T2 [Synchiropus picturatus]